MSFRVPPEEALLFQCSFSLALSLGAMELADTAEISKHFLLGYHSISICLVLFGLFPLWVCTIAP